MLNRYMLQHCDGKEIIMTENQTPPENNQPETKEKGNKLTKSFYIKYAIVYSICILFILVAINYNSFSETVSKFISVLSPVFYGFIIAYLCNPLFKLFYERLLIKIRSVSWRKTLSMILTYAVVFLLIFAFLFILIQQAIISIDGFLGNVGGYLSSTEAWLTDFINNLDFIKSESELDAEQAPPLTNDPLDSSQGTTATPETAVTPETTVPAESETAPAPSDTTSVADDKINLFDFHFTKEGIIKSISELLNNSQQLILTIGNRIVHSSTAAAIIVFNVFIGFILSVYILAEKDMLCAKAKKATMALFKEERAKRYISLARYSNLKIGHFIKGKLLETVIVGAISYLLFLIFGIPSPLMIALLVAVMNMIPVFGPFLGAIPAAFLVLIMDPTKAIPYIIITVIVMQVNGNYISPKIVGNITGLTPFGAILSLLLMSGYFGIIGMFIGIPICAIVVEVVGGEMDKRLKERNLSTNLDDYYSPEALADIVQERTHPKKHRNITAIVVDTTVLAFRKLFRLDKVGKTDKKDKKN